MPLLLMQLGAHPQEIAATKRDECLDGGAFFLDFTRPLRRERWFLAWNERVGPVWALHVPVIHQGRPRAAAASRWSAPTPTSESFSDSGRRGIRCTGNPR